MDIYINERSFNGQCADLSAAKTLLNAFLDTLDATDLMRSSRPVKRTKNLKSRPIIGEQSILDICHQLGKSKINKDKDQLRLILTKIVKGPYIARFNDVTITVEDENGTCLKGSSLDSATLTIVKPVMVSCPNGKIHNKETITVTTSSPAKIPLLNINNAADAKKLTWYYEVSPKHKIKNSITVNGNIWSPMPLDADEAQKVLSNSVLVGKSTYGLFEQQWYQFNNHKDNYYHGFPVENKGNDADLNQAKRLLEQVNYQQIGQILL